MMEAANWGDRPPSIRLGIDASNIRAGGGVTHLYELLRAANPPAYGFVEVIVWSGGGTLDRIEDRPWLVKARDPSLEQGFLHRTSWQWFRLSTLARERRCDLLFVPGGSYAGDFRPIVTMSRNSLPFEWRELRRYGLSWMSIKLLLLRWAQSRSFRSASGMIFLTRYARDAVLRVTGPLSGRQIIVSHGVDESFISAPSRQRAISDCSERDPFRLLYVSTVDVYKHQWNVVEAVARLREAGYPIQLELIGAAYGPALKRLRIAMDSFDSPKEFIRYHGALPYRELPKRYRAADVCVFASSCENMPNILLEGMAAGLPVACSNRGPMPEILGEAGAYFDPEDPESIRQALGSLIDSPSLRLERAQAACKKVSGYSWRRCAHETFSFLQEVALATSAIRANPK